MKIEFKERCVVCGGSGIYVGICERDGAGVVCSVCDGSGCHHFVYEYEEFNGRIVRDDIRRVYQINVGKNIFENKELGYHLEDFGGITYEAWLRGGDFYRGTENRLYVCPAWWYQNIDNSKKPRWDECMLMGSFSSCKNFVNKDRCWVRWDRENIE